MGDIPSEFRVRPGEAAEEYRARTERIFEEKRAAREEERRRKDEEAALRERKEREAAEEERGRRSRVAGQERAVSQALAEFEEERGRLYRGDGAKFYAEEEHAERLASLTEHLQKRVQDVMREAEQDARRYEEEARALSYIDPTAAVPAAELARLESAKTLVSEDCERLSVEDLVERLRAVAAGGDKVAKVLHARHGRFRLEELREGFDWAASTGSSELIGDAGERAREIRLLEGILDRLDEDVADPVRTGRIRTLREAAAGSRQAAAHWRLRLAEADGTDERARRESEGRMRSTL